MDGAIMDGVGDRVRQARLQAGLDQATLAGRLGVGIKTIYNWEHEEAVPTPENWARLALELGRTVRWFQEGDQDSPLEARISKLEEEVNELKRRLDG